MRGKTIESTTNPYSSLKKVFIDFAYSKLVISYTKASLTFHVLSLLLEVYYLVTNFSVELICRYGCMMCLMTYVVATKLVGTMYSKKLKLLEKPCLLDFWKVYNSSTATQRLISEKSSKTNRRLYCALTCCFFLAIILFPIWGDLNEFFIFSQVYEKYFTSWAPAFCYFYVSTLLWCCFYCFHLPGIIMYLTLHLDLQFKLIKDKITEIDKNCSQKEIYQILRLCISHHVALKKWMDKLADLLVTIMPFFFLFGALNSIATSFFVLYTLQNTTMILKIRLGTLTLCNFIIVSTFAEVGQIFSGQNNSLFEQLMDCSWYLWNIKNRKTLLMFMLNCMKPKTFSWGGITLNYSFVLFILKTSLSYASVLFKLRGETF
ncbi:odorant receptor 159 [Tribolium castaneum]|uniref:Odorant receptor n=1 Tax=Tribolium castaneum TaxID=7070 RepID=D2A272_TRICA|nr:odorant receptor 159 [Tribolium castaneum]